MRIVADFLIVIGAMLLTGAAGMIAVAVGHAAPRDEPLVVLVLMVAMIAMGMFTAGILVHLRRWQKD